MKLTLDLCFFQREKKIHKFFTFSLSEICFHPKSFISSPKIIQFWSFLLSGSHMQTTSFMRYTHCFSVKTAKHYNFQHIVGIEHKKNLLHPNMLDIFQ